ncbi:kinase-like domain-containing protein [Russula emetica]|nr:kinase-like domain-containing protein [Russula emetica]
MNTTCIQLSPVAEESLEYSGTARKEDILVRHPNAVQSLHDRHYIHRDIKPGNFMIRADNLPPTLFLIDFGLARLFHGQQGNVQSRRDDLESLAYTIIYSALGELPWTSNSAGNDEEVVLRKKTSITVEELCEGLPAPFCKFVTYVRSLGFDKKPDYQFLHSILLQCSETVTDQPIKAPPHVSVDRAPIFTSRVLRSSTRAIAKPSRYIHQTPARATRTRSWK